MSAPKLSLGEELKAFRAFALKGNVIDLAFAVIIGAAFSKIVDSLVKDIIMPVIGLVGSADFSNYFLPLSHNVTATNLTDAQKQGAVLAWGSFLTYVVNFMIVAFVLFLIVKAIRKFQTTKEDEKKLDPVPTGEEKLLAEIRDILARQTPIR